MLQDLRYAVRMLVKSPNFTMVAVITLALGIGANTSIFSVLNAVSLQPLPVERENELVAIYSSDADGTDYGTSAYPDFQDWRAQCRSFAGLAGWAEIPINFSHAGETERIWGQVVTGNYFDMLGVKPTLGRGFLLEEDVAAGTHPVVVISEAMWRSRFGGQQSVLGAKILLNRQPFTVIGVAPRGFNGTGISVPMQVWVPMHMTNVVRPRAFDLLTARGARWMNVVGRLKPGVSVQQAREELSAIQLRLGQTYAQTNQGYAAVAMFPLKQARLWPDRQNQAVGFVQLLLGITGIVLLIACVNVANLLLVRANARRREIAVRLSLGAGRGRLIRMLLAESVLLSLMAGVASVLVAMWGMDLLAALRPPEFSDLYLPLQLNASVMLFTFALAVLTGLFFGLAPAWQATRADLASSLKDEAWGDTRRTRLRSVLVGTQVALSMVLLVASGLLLRSLLNAQQIEIGFQPANLVAATVDVRLGGYDEARGAVFYERLLQRLRALPGVRAASLTESVPLSIWGWSRRTVYAVGREVPPNEGTEHAISIIAPDYFRTMGIPVVRGREFSERDTNGSPRVVIVNEALAEHFWPGQDALGKQMSFQAPGAQTAPPLTVVGVVTSGKYRSLAERPRPFYFLPLAQEYNGVMTLVVRGADAASLAPLLRKEVQALDANLPLFNLSTVEESIQSAYFIARATATFVGIFAALSLVLATVGIYGVTSYAVVQRFREIGIRMALGARPADVVALFVRRAMALVFTGLAVGLIAAAWASRLLRGLLYGIAPGDPLTYAGVVVALAAVALVATLLPARRAARVDPIIALRYE